MRGAGLDGVYISVEGDAHGLKPTHVIEYDFRNPGSPGVPGRTLEDTLTFRLHVPRPVSSEPLGYTRAAVMADAKPGRYSLTFYPMRDGARLDSLVGSKLVAHVEFSVER